MSARETLARELTAARGRTLGLCGSWGTSAGRSNSGCCAAATPHGLACRRPRSSALRRVREFARQPGEFAAADADATSRVLTRQTCQDLPNRCARIFVTAIEVCPTAATAHVGSSLCRPSSAVLCAAELGRQSHHDAVGALSSTRTSAALRTMPSGGAVVPPSVVTYMTLPTSPGSRPQ
jgi:hypothetical protein